MKGTKIMFMSYILGILKPLKLSFNDVVTPIYEKDDDDRVVRNDKGEGVTRGFSISWKYSHLFDLTKIQDALLQDSVGYYAVYQKDITNPMIGYNQLKSENKVDFEFCAPIYINKEIVADKQASDVFGK
tara:strand:+ start:573 stop:959 length:387 start_codon:yes stop_codon:yes gene_type:complete